MARKKEETKKAARLPKSSTIMDALDIIREREGYTKVQLAEECGVSKVSMHRRFREGHNISVSLVVELAKIMGYELVLVPMNSVLPKDAVRVDHPIKPKHEIGGRR